MDLELATIAGAGIDLPDRETSSEEPARRHLYAPRKLGESRIVGSRCALCQRQTGNASEQHVAHAMVL